MRSSLPTGLLLFTLLFTSCAKEALDVAQDLGVLPSTCGSDGARLQATVDGSSYCASAQILAIGDSSSVVVTGIDLSGGTLVLQLDTLAMGDHAMTEAANAVLFMQMGSTFTIAAGSHGTLSITEHDPATRRLKATFTAPVHNELTGQTKAMEGEVDLSYSIGG